jgi:hypothetical protein
MSSFDQTVVREDEYEIIHGYELRKLPGEIFHLRIQTAYKHPQLGDASDGVEILFGNQTAVVRVVGLPGLYQTWAEAGRYEVTVVFIPARRLKGRPGFKDFFNTEVAVTEAE